MPRQTLFISDLHLDPTRPEIIQMFANFIDSQALRCEALYILGDLFEYWIGDDQPTPGLAPVFDAFEQLKSHHIPTAFIHGNRDFLIGEQFARRTGITLLDGSTCIDLYGEKTLIMHGDTLCTDDIEYQKMRQMFRNPAWKEQFLSLPIEERINQAQALRQKSKQETGEKSEQILDVNENEVRRVMQTHGVKQLIHGHTHRPAVHDFQLDDAKAKRIVLGDWYSTGSVLVCTEDGSRLETL